MGTRRPLAAALCLAAAVALPAAAQPRPFAPRADAAVRAADHAALIKLAAENPRAFDCRRVDWAWALGEAYAARQRRGDALALAERLIVRSCTDEHRLTTLYKAREWVAPAAWEALLERESSLARAPAVDDKFRRLQYDHRVAGFHAAPAAKLFEPISAEVERYQDSGTALAAAWLYFNQGDVARAKQWFGRVQEWRGDSADTRYGLALCASREGRFDDALQGARALPAGYPDRERLMQEALLGKARSAYDAKNYADAAALLREAGVPAPLPRYGASQYGWTLLHLGDAEGASSVFERLYREAPDMESAQGLTESTRRAGKPLSSLAAYAQSEPLASLINQASTQRMLDEKRFLSAARSDAAIAPSLGAAGVAQLSLAGAWRDKSGEDGTSRLRMALAPALEAGAPVGGRSEIFVRVDRVRLDSGPLPANALVGSGGPGAYAFEPVTHVDGVQPQLFARVEGEAVWQASLGMTPSDGALNQRPFGRVERRAYAPWGYYDLAAFAEPVRESILSYVGLRDPYTGATWGRVLRYGGEARALWLLGPDWALSAGARGESIKGSSVADNERFRADASFGRNLGLRGFDYAVAGVEAGFDGYRRNLSQFTLGNGGYYSPQEVWRGGVALNFLTEERRPWIARGRVSAGRLYRVQDGSFAGGRDDGHDASLELSAMWQLSPHLQAGMMLARSTAPQYDTTTGGLLLRVLFAPRNSVTSGDLPGRLLADLR